MFLQDFMAKKRFLHILAPFLECKKGIFFKVVAKWGKCKKNHFFCRNGLYPCWYKIYQEAMRFWKLFGILVHPNLDPGLFPLTTSIAMPSKSFSKSSFSSSTCSTSVGSQFIRNSSSFTSSSMCNISSSTSAMILSTESPMFKIFRLSASEMGKQLIH